jgi:hypothetical protein
MGMGIDNSVSQPSGKGQPTMGAPNQYMQGQTGNGDPNNSNGTVSTPSPTVSAPTNDYRSTVGMPQWDSSQISAGPSGKGSGGGKMSGGDPSSGKGSSAMQPAPSGGKGDMSQTTGQSVAPISSPIAAPDVVPTVAPYVPPAQPAPVVAPQPAPTSGKANSGFQPHGH